MGCVAAWFMDTFEVSLLLPHGRPAAFQASTFSWQRDDRELMTPGRQPSTSEPPAYALPDYVAIHQRLFGSQLVIENEKRKKKWQKQAVTAAMDMWLTP